MSDVTPQEPSPNRENLRVVGICLGIVLGMGGLAYASVPLYDLFCRITGYGGTTQRVENAYGVEAIDRVVNVRFDSNTAADLNWEFAPEKREVSIRMGEQAMIKYIAKNLSDKPIVGMASFNVTPQSAGVYFNKMECFCFTDTYIEPGGTLEMPVVFYVDPEMAGTRETMNINTITLSYTFFESDTPLEEVVAENKAEAESSQAEGKL